MLRLGPPGLLGSLTLLGLTLLGPSGRTQDGRNLHVLGSAGDVIYSGGGAGAGITPGVDAYGWWMAGQDMQGATFSGLTDGSGQPTFGYRQTGLRMAVCVLNNPVRLDFPGIVVAEFSDTTPGSGSGFHDPFVFLRPGCDDPFDGVAQDPDLDLARDLVVSSAFGMPTGTPPGSSVSWLTQDDVPGLPSASTYLKPNVGLLPSLAPLGQETLVAVTSLQHVP